MSERIDTEVAIIGGGLGGCSAALHLSRRGVPVALLDKGAVGAGASGVNFGGVRRNGRHLEELPLAERSLVDYWRKLESWIGSDCEYAETGHLKFGRDEKDAAELEAYAEQALAHGLKLEILSRNALEERCPWVGEDGHVASWSPTDGQANPRLVGPAIARAARAEGVEIREQSEVTAIVQDGHGFELETENGILVRAKALINAAGAWGAKIAAMFGEEVILETVTPQMVVTEPMPYVIEPVTGVCGGSFYLRQIPRGNIIIGNGGGGVAELDASRAYVVPERTLETLRDVVRLIPRVADAHVIRVWTGLEGATPDHTPVLGPSRTTPGLFHSFGYSGHGFQLGPAAGAVLAELVRDGKSKSEIGAFGIERFAKPEEGSGGTARRAPNRRS
ncbi:MAG: FAD-dependent oxidoreductase [Proteobacteria bacterium]|nr:FAD-dependent oxidoreductase [Pseudomonadota bacterium]